MVAQAAASRPTEDLGRTPDDARASVVHRWAYFEQHPPSNQEESQMMGTRHMGVRYLGMLVAGIITLGLYTPASPASAAVAVAASSTCVCKVTVNPVSGARGSSIEVTGQGFTPNVTVSLQFVDAALNRTVFASPKTGVWGRFKATIRIPATAAYGHGGVVAEAGARKARGNLLVTKGCSTVGKMTRHPASGRRNSSVDVAGTGFCPGTRVRIRLRDSNLNWTTLATGVPVDAAGTFATTVIIPADASRGDGYLTLYDASSHQDAKVLFTVKP